MAPQDGDGEAVKRTYKIKYEFQSAPNEESDDSLANFGTQEIPDGSRRRKRQ